MMYVSPYFLKLKEKYSFIVEIKPYHKLAHVKQGFLIDELVLNDEPLNWLKTNCTDEYYIYDDDYTITVMFASQKDAFTFKMVWL